MSSHPKRIGFLSFGAWHPAAGMTNSAADAVQQTLELAVAAEEIGIDGAFVRVHHFARQLSAPFPLLAAIGARTSRLEAGTAVIDMRYENPLYMAEDAAMADLLAGGRLQLGISRGSPEPAWHGAEAFGYAVDADDARKKTEIFRAAISGAGVVAADAGGGPGDILLPIQPQSPGLAERIWWGSGTRESAAWVGEQGMNLMSSTLLLEDTKVPFDELQAEQIGIFRDAWTAAGHAGTPRVSVSRSVMPITSELDQRLFGGDANEDQVGWLDGALSRFGRSYTGAPDQIAVDLADDAAVQAADTLMLTVPSQLGVEYNAAMLATIAREIRACHRLACSERQSPGEAAGARGQGSPAAGLSPPRRPMRSTGRAAPAASDPSRVLWTDSCAAPNRLAPVERGRTGDVRRERDKSPWI